MKKTIKKTLTRDALIKFAKSLYKKTEKTEFYVPLCHGQLTKPNGKVLNCALGEMYTEFVGPTCRPATKKEQLQGWAKDGHVDGNSSKWVRMMDDTGLAAEALEKVAKVKETCNFYNVLAVQIPNANDSVPGMSESAMIKRAKKVQKKLIEVALGYLED